MKPEQRSRLDRIKCSTIVCFGGYYHGFWGCVLYSKLNLKPVKIIRLADSKCRICNKLSDWTSCHLNKGKIMWVYISHEIRLHFIYVSIYMQWHYTVSFICFAIAFRYFFLLPLKSKHISYSQMAKYMCLANAILLPQWCTESVCDWPAAILLLTFAT